MLRIAVARRLGSMSIVESDPTNTLGEMRSTVTSTGAAPYSLSLMAGEETQDPLHPNMINVMAEDRSPSAAGPSSTALADSR